MAENAANAANQVIDTNQPRPLNGLKLRGVRMNKTVATLKRGAGPDGEDVEMIVKESDYNKELHGEKIDKLPARKKVAKKKKVAKAGKEEQ